MNFKKKYGKTRKIRSVFYLTNVHKQKRIDFCKKLLKKGIEGKNIFFTDETIIDLAPAHDSIRLTPKKKKEINEGKEEALNLVTVQEKKYETLHYDSRRDIILWS